MNHRETSPALSDVFDAITMGPSDYNSLSVLVERLQNPDDKRRALGAINNTQTISQQDRQALQAILGSRRNAVTVSGGRNISAWTPDSTTTIRPPAQLSNVPVVEVVASNNLITSSLPEGVTQAMVLQLALEQIGNPLTEEKIKSYQFNQNLSIDGKIGKRTFGEMQAKAIERRLRNDMGNGFISENLQAEILALLNYANLNGRNLQENLLPYIYLIKREAQDELSAARFKEVYGDFFAQVEAKMDTNTTEGASALTESVQAEFDRIHGLSEDELQAALDEANTNQPEKENDKRAYVSEFVRRYKDAGNSIIIDANNRYVLVDIAGNNITTALSQEDLQSMLILLATDGEDIFKRDMLKENIANNVFDYVVTEFDLESADKTPWQAGDFEVSALKTQDEVDANKTLCISQLQDEINTLRATNNESSTNKSQKQSNILMIQKLEIAKIFVDDKSRLSNASLEFARNLTNDREEIARALGTTEEELVRLYGQIEGGDVTSIMKSMLFPGFLAFIAGIFSRLLPEGIMRKTFQGGILGYLGIKLAGEAEERGIGLTRPGNVSGNNDPVVEGSDTFSSLQEALNAILTDAPAGLESRHKETYALSVKYNNENQGGIDSREKLDTIFLTLSQDSIFRNQDISTIKDLNASSVESLMSAESLGTLRAQGISNDEITTLIRILKEISTDTQDKTIGDVFVKGLESNESNVSNVTWVAGESFSEQNKIINQEVLNLSGMSFGVKESIRGDSVRANVEEILGKAQPGFVAWATANVLERANMDDWNITHPALENIKTTITDLKAAMSNASTAEDQAAIGNILLQYTSIKETLEKTQKIDEYLSKATSVYGITGATVRLGENVVNWVKGLGDPIATNPATVISASDIDAMIGEGEALAANPTYADRKTEIQAIVENLRLYRINRLDAIANDDTLSDADRVAARTESATILKETVIDNETLYINTLTSMEQEMMSLQQNHTTTESFIAALASNRENLSTLKRFSELNTGVADFDNKAQDLYQATFTKGIVKNFSVHIASTITKISAIDITTISPQNIVKKQEEFNKLRDQLLITGWDIDVLQYFKVIPDEHIKLINGENTLIVASAMSKAFSNIDGSPMSIAFDDQLVTSKQEALDAKQREINGVVQNEIITGIEVGGTTFLFESSNINELIDVSNDAHITALIRVIQEQETKLTGLDRTKLDGQISDIVDMFTKGIPNEADDVASDKIDILKVQYDRFEDAVGNAENDNFEDQLKIKAVEIVRFDMLNETVQSAPPSIEAPMLEIYNLIPDSESRKQELASILNNDESRLQEAFTIIDAIIADQEILVTRGVGSSTIEPLKNKREEILLLLSDSNIVNTAEWIKSLFDYSETALRTFYNTLTR